MFTSDRAREVYLDWEPEARAMLGRFRLPRPLSPHAPDFSALIDDLQRISPQVRDWWPRHDVKAVVAAAPRSCFTQGWGRWDYSHVVLQVADNPDQTLVTYSPATPLETRPIAIPWPAVLDAKPHPHPGR